MVFVRKCASDCRLKYDSHPIRFDLGPHARETATALARPPANRTDGQNRAWGFVWRNARFIMRPSKHMPAQRRAIEPSPPCRSLGGSSMYNRWWHNRKQQADGGRKRGDLSIDRRDTQTQRAYASVHRSIAVTRPAASTNSIRQSLQGICTISCIAGEIAALARSEIRARMTGRGDRTPRR